MKEYVTGWRRRAATAARPDKAPAVSIEEPAPAPAVKRKAAPPVEVIDARPARQPISVPTIRIPTGMGSLFLLGVAIWVFTLSTSATHAAFSQIWPGITWGTCAMVQLGFSVIERFFFVGNRNGVTWFVLIVDAIINAYGIFVGLLPAIMGSGMWLWLVSGTPFASWAPDGNMSKLIALLLGAALAYGGDALFDMSMRGR